MTTTQELSPRAKRYAELDRLAYELGPNMDDVKLFSLKFEEMSYVLGMAHLYMLNRLGAVSKNTGAKIKSKYIRRCEQVHHGLIYSRYLYHRQLACTLTYAKDMRELTQLINEKSPTALNKALEIIDTLSGDYIYSKLYENTVRGGDYEAAICEVTVEKDKQAELKKAFEGLLSEITNDRLPSFFDELSDEEIKEISERIPTREIIGSGIPEQLKLKP